MSDDQWEHLKMSIGRTVREMNDEMYQDQKMSTKKVLLALGLVGTTGLAGYVIWKFWKSKPKMVNESTQTSSEQPTVIYSQNENNEGNLFGRPIQREVQAEEDIGVEELDPDSRDYNIYRRGVKRLALSIVNIDYSRAEGVSNRNFAVLDKKKNVFLDLLGFESYDIFNKDCEVVLNADKTKFELVLERIKERIKNESIGCLVVMISSHGTEKMIEETRGCPRHREHFITLCDGHNYRTKDLIDMFQPQYCTRTNIPKIFIIQGCRDPSAEDGRKEPTSARSSSFDPGITFYVVDQDSDEDEEVEAPVSTAGAAVPPPVREMVALHNLPAIPPCAPDTMVIFGSAPGMQSFGGSSEGSWIFQSLYDEVTKISERQKDEDRKISLFAVLNKVNCSIATKKSIKEQKLQKAAGSFTHQMTKDLKLRVAYTATANCL